MAAQVCRCCLLDNPTYTFAIFDGKTVGGVNGEDLCTALLSCAPQLHIQPDDGLPDVICDNCLLSVREALAFRRRCEESERELRKRYADSERYIEEALQLGNTIESKEDEVVAKETTMATTMARECPAMAEGCLQQYEELGANELALLDDLLQLEENNNAHGLVWQTGGATIREEDENYFSGNFRTCRANEELDLINEDALGEDAFVEDAFVEDAFVEDAFVEDAFVEDAFVEDAFVEDSSTSASVQQAHDAEANANLLDYDSTISGTSDDSTLSSAESHKQPDNKCLYHCTRCEKKFTRSFQLKLHMISVHKVGKGMYKCQDCDRTFAARHTLNYHRRSVHLNERPFQCLHCSRRFVLRSQMLSHMRVHTSEKKERIFQCLECGKRWPTKSDLRTHMRSHVALEKRPFKCNQCEKAFFTRGHLSAHALVHSGEKPFSCAICGKSYQCVGNLNNHMAKQHNFQRCTAKTRGGGIVHMVDNYQDVFQKYAVHALTELV